MSLIVPILLNCLLCAGFYIAQKHTAMKKLPYTARQIIIGAVFGALSAFASDFGVELLGTVVNVRDAAPLTAGLVFGAPSGIIAGVIGGVYRWVSVAWGAGEYTQLACTVATICAGCIAAVLRKHMFDDKRPTWGYGIAVAIVCEVVHMMLIFLTNMKDSAHAFQFVKGASIPMIAGNALAVGLAVAIVSLLGGDRLIRWGSTLRISQTFQRGLLVCILIAFCLTSVFTYTLQNGMARMQTKEIFTTAIQDVYTDVRGKSDDYMLNLVNLIADEYESDPDEDLETLAAKHGVIEINIVDDSGLILRSTEEGLAGVFNMNDTEQSSEFSVLTQGQQSFVQVYGPVGSDGKTMRKFAGVALEDGGYIQVGYSAEQFHKMLDAFVTDVTKNRHVGSEGFVGVCDEELKLVTQNERNGDHISTLGIIPNEEMKNGLSAKELCKATVVNEENGYSRDYIYAFTFVEGYCIIAAMPEDEAMFMRDASIYNSVFMQVLIFASLFVFIYVLVKRVILNNLKKINSTLSRITDGDLDVTVDVRSSQEFASLSDDINSTVSTLKRYIAEAAARIDKELEYAKQIQLSALPSDFPESEDYTVNAVMLAAREVGGDFYDFYKLDDNTVAFLVADVSGKGIPAAMFMMTAKTIIKDLAEGGAQVNEIFTRANAKLCENNESGMFVTAWMGILNLDDGTLKFANAGHNPPLLRRADGKFEYLRSRAGLVLAGMDGVQYRINEIKLQRGDRILLYTDGVTEATDENDQLYGEDRLLAYANENASEQTDGFLKGLKADIDSFAGSAPQFDDITMLLFDYKPNAGGIKTEKRTFPASDSALDGVIEFIQTVLSRHECPRSTQNMLCVAIEEVFVNVAHYAYGQQEGDVSFTISFDEAQRKVTFVMADKGVPFDPLAKPDPDITLSAEERQIGGLGIFITKKTMDHVSYSYENGENILTMIKTI